MNLFTHHVGFLGSWRSDYSRRPTGIKPRAQVARDTPRYLFPSTVRATRSTNLSRFLNFWRHRAARTVSFSTLLLPIRGPKDGANLKRQHLENACRVRYNNKLLLSQLTPTVNPVTTLKIEPGPAGMLWATLPYSPDGWRGSNSLPKCSCPEKTSAK